MVWNTCTNDISFVVDEGEVFQVRKSSHSKKIMKLLDKERRKKKEEKSEGEQVKSKTEDKRTEIVTGDLVVCVNYLHFSLCFPCEYIPVDHSCILISIFRW